MLVIDSYYKLRDILQISIGRMDRDCHYAVYWKDIDGLEPELDDLVLVSGPIEVTDSDEEIFPKIVRDKGWWICFRDELIQDVVDNALHQKLNPSAQELLEALRYYNHYDCFIDLLERSKNYRLKQWSPDKNEWETPSA